MLVKSLLIWGSIIPLAILNGLLREKVIIPFISAEYGLLISAILLSMLGRKKK